MSLVSIIIALATVAPLPGPNTGQWKNAPTPQVQAAAANGDAKAALELGLRYDSGRAGVTKNPDEAIKWLRKAADAGDVDAETAAAVHLAYGNGPESDKVDAFNYLKQAVAKGDVQATYELGLAYKLGRGTIANDAEALPLLTKAVGAGIPAAQFELADSQETGKGAPANPAEAMKNFLAAANQNYLPAQHRLGQMYIKGAPGVAADPREGQKWLLKAASAGYVPAEWDIAKQLEATGPTGKEKAATWYKKLAEQKDLNAQIALGNASPETVKKMARPLQMTSHGPDETLVGTIVAVEGTLHNAAQAAATAERTPSQPIGRRATRAETPTPAPPPTPTRTRGAARVTPATPTTAAENKWTIDTISRGGEFTFPVDVSHMQLFKGQDQMHVTLYAALDATDRKTLHALTMEATAPKFEWKYNLTSPTGSAVAAGHNKTWIVEGAVKNTGKQLIKNMKVQVRVYQQSSPNDAKTTLDIPQIAAGAVQPFSVSVEMYNFEYIGATSTPKVEITVLDYSY